MPTGPKTGGLPIYLTLYPADSVGRDSLHAVARHVMAVEKLSEIILRTSGAALDLKSLDHRDGNFRPCRKHSLNMIGKLRWKRWAQSELRTIPPQLLFGLRNR